MGDSEKHERLGNAETQWEHRVLCYHQLRTDLANERKYLGWLRVSLGLITLGFVVERLDLFLVRTSGTEPLAMPAALGWVPPLIFGTGATTIVIATWEFFADRRRIALEKARGSSLLIALIMMTLISVVLIAVLLWLPGVDQALQ